MSFFVQLTGRDLHSTLALQMLCLLGFFIQLMNKKSKRQTLHMFQSPLRQQRALKARPSNGNNFFKGMRRKNTWMFKLWYFPKLLLNAFVTKLVWFWLPKYTVGKRTDSVLGINIMLFLLRNYHTSSPSSGLCQTFPLLMSLDHMLRPHTPVALKVFSPSLFLCVLQIALGFL